MLVLANSQLATFLSRLYDYIGRITSIYFIKEQKKKK